MSTKTDKQFTEQCNTIHYITSQCHIEWFGDPARDQTKAVNVLSTTQSATSNVFFYLLKLLQRYSTVPGFANMTQ